MAAVRICEAQQWWVSPLDESKAIIDEILEEELYHRKTMKALCEKYEAPETVLDPIFAAGAYVIGVGTASLGKESMMMCHAAVEEVITEHYNSQLRELYALGTADTDPLKSAAIEELSTIVASFRDDEMHHQELGEQNGSADAPMYSLLHPAIQAACRFGIVTASRI
jgi:ubiquinone biosynthesis monooxygenase Coq7